MLSACSGDNVTTTPTPASIVVSSPSSATTAGGTIQFTATVKDANGNTLMRTPTWSVTHGGGTINASGLFTAGDSVGTFTNTVVASLGAVSSTGATVTVTSASGALTSIQITPDTTTVPNGGTHQYVVTGRDANNNVVPIVPAPTWSVVAGGGTIDQNGLFTAGTAAGTFVNTLHVASGALFSSISVTVAPGALTTIAVTPSTATLAIGATQQYMAVGHDAHTNVVAITPTWSVAASGGTIDSGTGLFTAGTVAGTFTNSVTATSGAISGTATVTVSPGPVSNLTIAPTSATIAVSTTQQFVVTATDAHGNVVAITPSWTVVAGGGTINSTGLFTAGTTPGTYTNTVVATSGSLAVVATVTVTP